MCGYVASLYVWRSEDNFEALVSPDFTWVLKIAPGSPGLLGKPLYRSSYLVGFWAAEF